jgi:hypothetical protein
MPEVGGPISGVGAGGDNELATDPPTSEPQRRAMHAAASGHSTLGIPQSVGKEFVESVGEGHDQTTGAFLDTLKNFLRGLLAWVGEEGGEEEHSADADCDAEGSRPLLTRELTAANDMALDRNSVRSKDADGRLHVEEANISKATVNPYKGEEIPDWESLGLDPEKTYQLLRHPDEIAKGTATFNNLPILSEHVPISAQDHPPELVIGSTGTHARFEPPYLKNSLVFWPQAAIDAIESGEKRELSCAYRYQPVMTPGVYEGQRYDGIMTNIVGNHVAAVAEGRAGHDVVIGDAKPPMQPEVINMSMKDALKRALTGKRIAQDADIDEILPLIETVLAGTGNGGIVDEPPMLPPNSAVPMGNQDQDPDCPPEEKAQDIKAIRARDAARRLGRDETDEEKKKREDDDEAADAAWDAQDRRSIIPSADETKNPQPDLVTKGAMDAAIAAAVRAAQIAAARTQREIREAEREVFPYVGELTQAFDSKDQVYAQALRMRGVDPAAIHPSAYPALLAVQPKAGAPQLGSAPVAMDAAALKSFAERFPETKHIRQV